MQVPGTWCHFLVILTVTGAVQEDCMQVAGMCRPTCHLVAVSGVTGAVEEAKTGDIPQRAGPTEPRLVAEHTDDHRRVGHEEHEADDEQHRGGRRHAATATADGRRPRRMRRRRRRRRRHRAGFPAAVEADGRGRRRRSLDAMARFVDAASQLAGTHQSHDDRSVADDDRDERSGRPQREVDPVPDRIRHQIGYQI